MSFLEQFDAEWGPRLGVRRETFRWIFQYLADRRPHGHLIVETGCARQPDNWAGDGQSTFLFDRFASAFEGEVRSVDLDPKACEYARSIAGPRTQVVAEDSVPFLHRLAQRLATSGRAIDLLYLDSYDFDEANPVPSMVHHLKELCAIAPALKPKTLVVVDDTFRALRGLRTAQNTYTLLGDFGLAGKGAYLDAYFRQIGVPMAFEGYQCGWVIPEPQG
jgi:SAM-dependent methyltransferase